MDNKLPTRLSSQPIIDAVFEFRFSATAPLSSVLPGMIFAKINGKKSIEKLPHSEIPETIRKQEPDLMYAPLIKVISENYSYLIGDNSVAVACNIPYRGWTDFKGQILFIIGIINEIDSIANHLARYSIKYVDLIKNFEKKSTDILSVNLKIGNSQIKPEKFQVRVEDRKEDFVNIIQIVSDAQVRIGNSEPVKGIVIDIDTIKIINQKNSISSALEEAKINLDRIHKLNKETFFDSLQSTAISSLGPEYD